MLDRTTSAAQPAAIATTPTAIVVRTGSRMACGPRSNANLLPVSGTGGTWPDANAATTAEGCVGLASLPAEPAHGHQQQDRTADDQRDHHSAEHNCDVELEADVRICAASEPEWEQRRHRVRHEHRPDRTERSQPARACTTPRPPDGTGRGRERRARVRRRDAPTRADSSPARRPADRSDRRSWRRSATRSPGDVRPGWRLPIRRRCWRRHRWTPSSTVVA